eukprot:scaffold19295_cov112-Isochrysis_galbana.AAC.1
MCLRPDPDGMIAEIACVGGRRQERQTQTPQAVCSCSCAAAAAAENSAHAVVRTMEPRQPTLPPMEVDMNQETGSKRVRPSRAEKSSMQ